MISVTVNNVSKNFGFGSFLENLSFTINEGDKVAIIGQNGTGKSTILKIIAGKEPVDKGTIDIKKNSKIGYLEQQISDSDDNRLSKDILLSAFSDILTEEAKLRKLEDEMSACSDDDKLEKLISKYTKMHENFMSIGGYEINTKIEYILSGLKIEKSMLEKPYNVLSGGEKTLIQFAYILLSGPDILLLDEPTNHLDLKRIEWLENYLSKFPGTVIVVSHDRYFLDNIAKYVIEIDDKKGTVFNGNYSYYVKEKENLELKAFETYKTQQKKIASMKEAVKRLKEWGEKGDNPAFFRRANAIQKRIDELEENSESKPKIQKKLPVNFVSEGRASNECVILENYTVKFGDKIIFDNVDFKFFQKNKVALVGDNGTGKSTLIKSIVGEFNDYNGTLRLGNVHIGYFEQIITFENPDQTVYDYYSNMTASNEEQTRRTLNKFCFNKECIFKKINKLSGGEKIRLKLAVLLKKEVNMLIFDEPTNHIDITTREVLEDTLKDFKGAMIIVSHDRYFISQIADRIVEIDNKKLIPYEGNYEYYRSEKAKLMSKNK